MSEAGTLVLITVAAVAAPLLAHAASRWLTLPLVVVEISLGILLGPDVLGLAQTGEAIDALSELGLSMLIFLAGYEIDFARVPGATLRRALGAWAVALAAALALAVPLADGDPDAAAYLGVALTSTALGTVLPVLRDSGALSGRFGTAVLTYGAVGEFGPIIAVALLLSGRSPGRSALVLTAFAVLTAAAVFWATRPRPPWFTRLATRTLHTSAQFAVRVVVSLLAAMLALASVFSLDLLLGAFAAGVLARLVLGVLPEGQREMVMGRVEGVGFGFLIPLFFVTTGIEFDLRSLLDGGGALLLLPVFLALFLLVRGLPVALFAPDGFSRAARGALALYCATALPLVVAVTTMGTDSGALDTSHAAALVGAGMVSVLVLPLLAGRLHHEPGASGRPEPGGRGPTGPEAAESESW
ncbi:cation:proton antiporter [Streptomyces sp. 4N509B]|uniref:cation:proton antiporter n=1 Tax=Streptomyces sp. 4N509B TaxID=3457413 RepID=UPI003FD14E97